MPRFRYVGGHAETLDSGQPLGTGDYVELTDEDVRQPHAEMLIANGLLIGADKKGEHEEALAERRVRSRLSRVEESDDKGGDS